MCAHIWVLNTQSLQLWYSSLKKKKVSDTSAQTMKSKRIFMIYIWSCVWQVFFAGFLFVDSSGCFHTCFVFFVFFSSMSCFDKFKMISSWGTLCWGFWRVCQDIHCHGGVCYVFFKWTQEQTLQETQLVCKSKRSFIRAEWRQTTRTLRRKTEDYS